MPCLYMSTQARGCPTARNYRRDSAGVGRQKSFPSGRRRPDLSLPQTAGSFVYLNQKISAHPAHLQLCHTPGYSPALGRRIKSAQRAKNGNPLCGRESGDDETLKIIRKKRHSRPDGGSRKKSKGIRYSAFRNGYPGGWAEPVAAKSTLRKRQKF